MDHEEYLKRVKSHIKTPTKDFEDQLKTFCDLCTYVSGQYDKDESFIELRKHMEELEKGREETNRVFYMALPPSVFIPVSAHLKKNCYPKNGITRIIVSLCSSFQDIPKLIMSSCRLRSPSAKIFLARESFSVLLHQTGTRMRFSELTITWAKRW
jgi:hypothetical protein